MTRVVRLAKGLGALGLLTVLVAGIPWALWHFVGWPLPHHVPSGAQIGRALNHQGIPDQTLVDALAVVVWLTWTTLVASLAVEIPAALSGRHAPHLPVAGVFQPLTGRLVATVIVACLALAPRPGHTDGPGPSGHPGSLLSRRPVATLVVTDTTFTAATHPIATTTPAPTVERPPTAAASPTTAAPDTSYVVQRGDTLWGIAQRQLGDPLRWSEIYQLNEGRPQPGGATLTDPHWIDPGWTLLLPATATPPVQAPATPTPTTPPIHQTHPNPPTATVPTSPATTAPSTTTPTAPTRHTTASQSEQAGPVRLPSGSVVAGSFAAGVAATLAIGRLRRRHAYRYRPPRPGRNLTPPPIRPTLDRLATAVDRATSLRPHTDRPPVFPFSDDERRLQPGEIEIGTRDDEPVTLDVTDLSGVALTGPATDPVARALLAALVVRAGPRAAEVLLTEDLAARLLPGLDPNPDMRVATDNDHAARIVEAERIARTRRLTGVDAPDAQRFRTENPENPLPALLVLLDDLPDESVGRWSALLDGAPRLGIAIVFLADNSAAARRLVLDPERTVVTAAPADLAERLGGVVLFGLEAGEAVELLHAVNEANQEGDNADDLWWDEPDAPITALHPEDGHDGLGEQATPGEEPWPADAAEHARPENQPRSDRPLVVEVFGPLRITSFGRPVTTGLRSRAQTLLAWALLRPEGATIDEIVDALWPDTPPDRVLKQFWHPLGDLRTYFRGPNKETLDVLEKVGEHYRPNPAEITCDLWNFQSALADAARANDDQTARSALRRATDAYHGDLLVGSAEGWVEPVRQDLHRRAVDAHLRLAELEDRASHPDAAVDVLERIIDLDRYAEEPYRRLMALHATHGRRDAVTATWQLLQRRLADLDIDIDEATARLYRTLIAPDPVPGASTTNTRPFRLTS
jgi:DNA-binding SARP family transcriptional activator